MSVVAPGTDTDSDTENETRDWATDFDHTDPAYAAAAPEIWADLRQRCPVAHTEEFGGAWLPTRHADVSAIAHDTEHFSSRSIIVSPFRPDASAPIGYAPPITSDPPFHEIARRLLLPAFSPKAVAVLAEPTRVFCRELLDAIDTRHAAGEPIDAAIDYAQHIPVRVIAHLLGVPQEDGDRFRTFIHRIMERPGQFSNLDPEETMWFYLFQVVEERRRERRDDLISFLLDAEIDGVPLGSDHVIGTLALLLIAGIDTTWSAIGASLFHLASHPEDRRRLVAEPELIPTAIEEFLRAYAPVTMARIVAKDVEIGDVTMTEGDWVLLPFPAANLDPDAFEDADRVLIDRTKNRHAAFGLGIHRCLGSNLARLELTIAVQEWLARFGEFELADPAAVRWSTGQVRGPRELPVVIGAGR